MPHNYIPESQVIHNESIIGYLMVNLDQTLHEANLGHQTKIIKYPEESQVYEFHHNEVSDKQLNQLQKFQISQNQQEGYNTIPVRPQLFDLSFLGSGDKGH